MFIRMIASAIVPGSTPGDPGSVPGAPAVVSISDDSSTASFGLTTGIIFNNAGAFSKYAHGVPIEISKWLTPQTNMGEFEIKATLESGDSPDTGTIGSWETLDTTREWTLTSSTPTDPALLLSAYLKIEIRWTGNNVVQDTAYYLLSSTSLPATGGGGGPGGGGGNGGIITP